MTTPIVAELQISMAQTFSRLRQVDQEQARQEARQRRTEQALQRAQAQAQTLQFNVRDLEQRIRSFRQTAIQRVGGVGIAASLGGGTALEQFAASGVSGALAGGFTPAAAAFALAALSQGLSEIFTQIRDFKNRFDTIEADAREFRDETQRRITEEALEQDRKLKEELRKLGKAFVKEREELSLQTARALLGVEVD